MHFSPVGLLSCSHVLTGAGGRAACMRWPWTFCRCAEAMQGTCLLCGNEGHPIVEGMPSAPCEAHAPSLRSTRASPDDSPVRSVNVIPKQRQNPAVAIGNGVVLGGALCAVRKVSCVPPPVAMGPRVLNSAPYSPCWYTRGFFFGLTPPPLPPPYSNKRAGKKLGRGKGTNQGG